MSSVYFSLKLIKYIHTHSTNNINPLLFFFRNLPDNSVCGWVTIIYIDTQSYLKLPRWSSPSAAGKCSNKTIKRSHTTIIAYQKFPNSSHFLSCFYWCEGISDDLFWIHSLIN